MGSFEQVEGVCCPGAGGCYGEAAVAGCGDGVSHAGRGGAGGCEDEQAGGVVAVGEVAQGAFGEVMGFTGSGDAGEKLGCHGFSLSAVARLYLVYRHGCFNNIHKIPRIIWTQHLYPIHTKT